MTPSGLLERELRRDGTRPLLTWYDDASGARVELSVATAANWAAKIANHLVDEDDVGPGDVVTVEPATHWITTVVLLGVWTAGAQASMGAPATLDVGLDPMGAGLARAVAAQPDQFIGAPVDETAAALSVGERTWSHAELADVATRAATHHGLGPDCRVLSTLPLDTSDGLDAGLLVPLAAGGSVVLVASVDQALLADRCVTENVTHSAGVDVPGLPRLD